MFYVASQKTFLISLLELIIIHFVKKFDIYASTEISALLKITASAIQKSAAGFHENCLRLY